MRQETCGPGSEKPFKEVLIMLGKTGHVIVANGIGFILLVLGWYISILNISLTRLQSSVLFTKWALLGLGLILVGAYLPRWWSKIVNRFNE